MSEPSVWLNQMVSVQNRRSSATSIIHGIVASRVPCLLPGGCVHLQSEREKGSHKYWCLTRGGGFMGEGDMGGAERSQLVFAGT